jgi:hypothetical protein
MKINQFPKVDLYTRSGGAALAAQIEEDVTLDWQGVDWITEHFADQFFADLRAKDVKFTNTNVAEAIQSLVDHFSLQSAPKQSEPDLSHIEQAKAQTAIRG